LTSQIFANIYLNELDRFVKHILKPQFYLRYGDDFIIIASTRIEVEKMREKIILFLKNSLGLEINRKNDIILPVRRGIRFLGVEIYSTGRRLKTKNWQRAQNRLNQRNVPSYYGLVKQHLKKKAIFFDWLIIKIYD
jgi:RNA-directed DNA polymerase